MKKTSGSQFDVRVNGKQWKRVASLDSTSSNDEVYSIVQDEEGGSQIIFGDGQRGRKPPTGARMQATYTYGEGIEGSVGGTIALTWVSGNSRKNEVIEVTIEPVVDGVVFRACLGSQASYKWKWLAMLCRKFKRCH